MAIWKNTEMISGREVSVPPLSQDNKQWETSEIIQKEMLDVRHACFGKSGEKSEMGQYRLCWCVHLSRSWTNFSKLTDNRDSVTPTEDFIISRHPRCRNLSFGAGGSFHGFKFLPTLGRYVVEMLDGVLAPDLVERWAWDRELKKHESSWSALWPTQELRDVV